MNEQINYTEAFEELQQIVNEIEEGEISVDELSEKVKRAALLINICKTKLSSTEEDVSKILKELETLGLQLANDKKKYASNSNLEGLSFLFTGTLNKLKRSEAEEIVEKNGGKIVSSVSSKLNYLVVGEDAGSKLEKAKKINSVKIITEDDFLNIIKI